MIDIEELSKDRKVYVLERDAEKPCVHKGKILGIVRSERNHYLRILTGEGAIKVQISGSILPSALLNNSIFFTDDDAQFELGKYREFLAARKEKPKSNIMGL